ncbi:hypothetical protein B0H11DRAFT_2223527 [Mycena galericulata]|nr:hypothetical protein B0H11DRAFT_2223527 [Mycena galericulata]
MSTTLSSSVIYRLFFLAALFLRSARAEIYVTGSPAGIAVGIILLLLIIGGGVAGCVILARRRKARVFVPPQFPQQPLVGDQVPMLAPPQGPFTDAAAVPVNTYAYAQNAGGYPQPQAQNTSGPYQQPQNTGGYPQGTGYNQYPPAASHSSVSLAAYPQDGNMHQNAPIEPNQNPFANPPGLPPPVVRILPEVAGAY